MKNVDINKLRNDIIEGMKLSAQKLKAQKKRLGQNMVVSENGVIKEIAPENLK